MKKIEIIRALYELVDRDIITPAAAFRYTRDLLQKDTKYQKQTEEQE